MWRHRINSSQIFVEFRTQQWLKEQGRYMALLSWWGKKKSWVNSKDISKTALDVSPHNRENVYIEENLPKPTLAVRSLSGLYALNCMKNRKHTNHQENQCYRTWQKCILCWNAQVWELTCSCRFYLISRESRWCSMVLDTPLIICCKTTW